MEDLYSGIFFEKPFKDLDISVEFVGDYCCKKAYSLPLHKNKGFEICLIDNGKGFFSIDETVYTVEKDVLFITNPTQLHSAYPSQEHPYRIRFICFNIGSEASDEWIEIVKRFFNIKQPVCMDNYELCNVHRQIIEECDGEKSHKNMILEYLLKQFILLVDRNFCNEECVEKITLTKKIMNVVDISLEKQLDLGTISTKVGYSVSHMSRIFKNTTGFSIIQYYNYMKLEYSKRLLNKGLSVSYIADKLNFSDVHHFSRSFKKLYNITPTEWRNN